MDKWLVDTRARKRGGSNAASSFLTVPIALVVAPYAQGLILKTVPQPLGQAAEPTEAPPCIVVP